MTIVRGGGEEEGRVCLFLRVESDAHFRGRWGRIGEKGAA